MEFEFYCPHHNEVEKLQVPDSYQYFEGEVDCSPPSGETGRPLKVRIVRGLLIDTDPL